MPITDRESAEAWLEGKPQEARVAFAARCALRALPGIATADRAKVGDIALPVLRATLTSGVAAVALTTEVEKATSASVEKTADYLTTDTERDSVYEAYNAAYFAAAALTDSASANIASASAASAAASAAHYAAHYATGSSAHSAARSADSAALSAARSAAWSAADADATRLDSDTPEFLFRQPLWSGAPMPGGLEEAYEKLKAFWAGDSDTWDFWARWYEKMLTGNPPPWDLQRDVALIANDVWEKGPQAVAERIREIEGEFDEEQPDLDETQLHEQALRLIARQSITVFLCRTSAEEIEAATRINNLPDEFATLRELPPIFRMIAELAQSRERIAELEAQVADLIGTVSRLTAALEGAKGKSRKDLFLDKFVEESASIAAKGFWALVGGAVVYVAGHVDVGDLLGRFSGAINELPLVGPEEKGGWAGSVTDA